ncbi:hypothetical protein [Xenorhabdus budapestensis]|uniref:Uncharacterized protein n=1 Tax=Xenorhabdus budapestensis TaxID=290110 RepID=A0A2D0J5D2_XENBU|nr:hypothetical protein [Xenorhabdus budapestensis]PHM29719.1 hypothetical protein Xbud_00256 [Xenorhabdus budapestensis]QTL39536.1 hypothetical protein HGO23_17375 [Xenorhabdus budapestensis]
MKYLKFFPEGFHLFEDVPYNAPNERRLTISGHGTLREGLRTLDRSLNFIEPEKLILILNRYLENDIFRYRHIRLLFCYSADNRGWYSDSFAGRFSRLLPNPDRIIVEAYEGEIEVMVTDYDKRIRAFEDISRLDWNASMSNNRDGEPKRVLASDYDIDDMYEFLFGSKSAYSETTRLKTAFWNSVNEFEYTFETCDPVELKDILASRIFFCNGKSSRNINDFR